METLAGLSELFKEEKRKKKRIGLETEGSSEYDCVSFYEILKNTEKINI